MVGLSSYQPTIKPIIAEVTPNGAGYRAGLSAGDEILAINDIEVHNWADVVQQIRTNPQRALDAEVIRSDQVISMTITPEVATENGKSIGRIGIAPKIDKAEFDALMVTVSYSADKAFYKAIEKTWETTILTLQMLSKMITGDAGHTRTGGRPPRPSAGRTGCRPDR